jgi:hypothetical protein
MRGSQTSESEIVTESLVDSDVEKDAKKKVKV